MSRSALVMGGGLAGMAAALRLADSGVDVTLIETRKRLGGRATSFNDPATGQTLDNCQHVLLKCCTNLIDLYERLGVADRIEWHDHLHFFDKQGRHDVLRASRLPAPLHLSPAMLTFGTLNMHDKLAIGQAMWRMIRTGRAKRAGLDRVPFAQWLREQGQTRRVMERFWSVVVVSACNQTPDQLSTHYAVQVFQDGFLAHRDAFVMGTSTVPLGDLYASAAERIEQAGGRVLTGQSVRALRYDDGRITGVALSGDRAAEADVYVSALPFDRLAAVCPDALLDADARLRRIGELTVSPILGVHLWFDRAPIDWPHMIFVDSPLQWVFNKGPDPSGGGHYLHGVISAAREWVDRPADETLAMALAELAQYEPAAARAELVRGRVIKEKRATFAAAPGVDALRPTAQGAVGNLILAGDWCATGWPATMEGAVRSGCEAAETITGRRFRHPDLPAGRLYRLLSADG